MRIAVKEVGKEVQLIDIDDKYRTDCCKKFTGEDDFVDYVHLNREGTFCIAVNEMGLPKDMPVNFLINTISQDFPIQKMVGTAVFVRTKYVNPLMEEIWDYEIEDLLPQDIEFIETILDEDYQKMLQDMFKDYGKGHVVIKPLFQ